MTQPKMDDDGMAGSRDEGWQSRLPFTITYAAAEATKMGGRSTLTIPPP